jgi:alpha-tubulin suppressor-like RCC1 family protein
VALNAGAMAISANETSTCALLPASVKCWGRYGGSLSLSNLGNLMPGVSAVSVGGNAYACALLTNGAVKCWGANGQGQLGNATTVDSAVPVGVRDLQNGGTAISAGGAHACALDTTSKLRCWGNNFYGQLGNGMMVNVSAPVIPNALASGVVAVSTGEYHTCAILNGGSVRCWGLNEDGQLGNGSSTSSPVPVSVSGLTANVIALAAGYHHTCALLVGGNVRCWGDNSFGQLGDGTKTSTRAPVDVSALAFNVAQIAVGSFRSCARLKSGAVKCWGSNNSGGLGNGTNDDSNTPLSVVGF